VIANCKNDYCDGCNALVFDEAGNHELCIGPIKADVFCESTKDCAKDRSEYCSQGICMPSGQCQNHVDCFNPENKYPVIECIGPLSCDENGFCGRTCADLACPVDAPDLSDECSPVSCDGMKTACSDEFTNCVSYSCGGDVDGGGCQSLVFNPSGQSICQDVEGVLVPPPAGGTTSPHPAKNIRVNRPKIVHIGNTVNVVYVPIWETV